MYGNRRSIRLKGFDYSKAGYYFVTVAVQGMRQLFWEDFGILKGGNGIPEGGNGIPEGGNGIPPVQEGLNEIGKMIGEKIIEIPKFYKGIEIDEWVVMPNHIHVILEIVGVDSHIHPEKRISVSEIIQRLKILTTNEYIKGIKNKNWPRFENRLWQRNFYERVIRSEAELNMTRKYIRDNPNLVNNPPVDIKGVGERMIEGDDEVGFGSGGRFG